MGLIRLNYGLKMRTSEKVKIKGFKSLKELAELDGKIPDTLRNWDKNNPEMFDEYLEEAWARKEKNGRSS